MFMLISSKGNCRKRKRIKNWFTRIDFQSEKVSWYRFIIEENEDYISDATDFYKNERNWFFGSAVNIEKSIQGWKRQTKVKPHSCLIHVRVFGFDSLVLARLKGLIHISHHDLQSILFLKLEHTVGDSRLLKWRTCVLRYILLFLC